MTSDEDARIRTSNPTGMAAPLPPPPGSSYPVRRRRPSGPWLLAILVILLLAAGTLTTLLIKHSHRTATPGSPSSQPTASAGSTAPTSASASPTASASVSASQSPAPPALLPRGEEAPASAIPWNQVNSGWNLRAWASGPDANAPSPSTLYLVNPIGGRYRTTRLVPNTAVVAWSPDHRRAITDTYSSNGRRVLVQEIELSTGHRSTGFLLGDRGMRGYAGPGARSLLLSHGGGLQGPLGFERVSISGVHQLNYPGSEPLTGELVGDDPRYTADGSAFLISGQRGYAVFSNDGALLRQINFPPSSICRAGHWWSDQVVQGVCSLLPRAGSSVNGPQNLVLISIGSGQIRQITKAPPPEYGYDVAWPYSGGILAQRSTSCGPGSLDTIRDNGTVRPFSYRLPAGASGQAGLVNVFADQASLITGNCGSRSRSLIGLNLRTGTATVLLGPGLNGGTVLG